MRADKPRTPRPSKFLWLAARPSNTSRRTDRAEWMAPAPGVILRASGLPRWEKHMSILFKQLGAAAVLLAISFTQASAQQVMTEPAYCAFYYPNANCQNKGPGNPYTDPNYRRGTPQYGPSWSLGETTGIVPKRARTHRTARVP